MSKLLVIPTNTNMIEKIYAEAVLLSIKDLSVNTTFKISVNQLKKIIKTTNKEIFVNINKNIHKTDLEKLEKTLVELSKLNIKGVFFYDLAVVNLNKRLNLKLNLVWAQEHLVVSSDGINFWHNQGVKKALLSTSLNLNEVKEIFKNTDSNLIIPAFGYMPMFTSKRKHISGYDNHFTLKLNKQKNKLHKEAKEYIITENKDGTTVYANSVLNIVDHLKDLRKIDYLLINTEQIENAEEVVNNFKKLTKLEIEVIIKKTTDHHFLDEIIIYKVKNEKCK